MDTQLDELWENQIRTIVNSGMKPEEKRRMIRDTLTSLKKLGWKGYELPQKMTNEMIEAFQDLGLLMSHHLDSVLATLRNRINSAVKPAPIDIDDRLEVMWTDAKDYMKWLGTQERLRADEEAKNQVIYERLGMDIRPVKDIPQA